MILKVKSLDPGILRSLSREPGFEPHVMVPKCPDLTIVTPAFKFVKTLLRRYNLIGYRRNFFPANARICADLREIHYIAIKDQRVNITRVVSAKPNQSPPSCAGCPRPDMCIRADQNYTILNI